MKKVPRVLLATVAAVVALAAFYALGSATYRAFTTRARQQRMSGIDAIEKCDALVKARKHDNSDMHSARVTAGLRKCNAEGIGTTW